MILLPLHRWSRSRRGEAEVVAQAEARVRKVAVVEDEAMLHHHQGCQSPKRRGEAEAEAKATVRKVAVVGVEPAR